MGGVRRLEVARVGKRGYRRVAFPKLRLPDPAGPWTCNGPACGRSVCREIAVANGRANTSLSRVHALGWEQTQNGWLVGQVKGHGTALLRETACIIIILL